MLPGESSRRVAPPAAGSGGNIDALPDGVLEHILGFLPLPDAVPTFVVARRWRQLWRSAPVLRVGSSGDDGVRPPPLNELREFVDRLLLLHEGSPLDTCDISLGGFQRHDFPRLNSWVRQAIACKAKALRLHMRGDWYLVLDDLPLVSSHLTRIELNGVSVHTRFLDFTSCPALEYLQVVNCILMATKMSAESLKHLSIRESRLSSDFRTRIHAPNLVSMCFDGLKNLTPKLDSMPSLVEGVVRMTDQCFDFCVTLSEQDRLDCLCRLSTSSCGEGVNSCVLFNGLSNAKSLKLTCNPSDERRSLHLPGMQFLPILFIWDLRWCPAFRNLKTLLLNEYWCMPDDLRPLVRILELCPVLEQLTLELFSEGPNYKVEMNGSISPVESSATISEHLNVVKVKCQAVDERVLKVFKILCTLNICFPL